jgi:Helix-hairpin-helix domain
MSRLETSEVSRLLREQGQRLEMEGGNPYRARAYGRAAENLSLISAPLDQLVAASRLKEIPGIGDALTSTARMVDRSSFVWPDVERLSHRRRRVTRACWKLRYFPTVKGLAGKGGRGRLSARDSLTLSVGVALSALNAQFGDFKKMFQDRAGHTGLNQPNCRHVCALFHIRHSCMLSRRDVAEVQAAEASFSR